ncbi:hypothetical protein [Nocardioides sp. Kera G14]|uniref:hypothetical protein n=1 Tax=Nocardioides sp. Kera G14 TaxID=2884264 RepID=UPI001D0FAA14|nr:hypothetical protein [Nocardioides sp. Kera G14]UDY24929.1 hypothetical protein LH076_06460 [Nocardioides sp. Kera G14]
MGKQGRHPDRRRREAEHPVLVLLLVVVGILAALTFGLMVWNPVSYVDDPPPGRVAWPVGIVAGLVVALCAFGITWLETRRDHPPAVVTLRRGGIATASVCVGVVALVGLAMFLVSHEIEENQKGIHAWGVDVEWSDAHFAFAEPTFIHPATVPLTIDPMADLDAPLEGPLPQGMKVARFEYSFHNDSGRNGGAFAWYDVIGPFLSVDGAAELPPTDGSTEECPEYVIEGDMSARPGHGAGGVRVACWVVPEATTVDQLVVRFGPGPNSVEWARWGNP